MENNAHQLANGICSDIAAADLMLCLFNCLNEDLIRKAGGVAISLEG